MGVVFSPYVTQNQIMNIEHLVDEKIEEIDLRMTQTFSNFIHRNLARMHRSLAGGEFEKAKSLKEYILKMIDVFEIEIKARETSDQ